MITQDEELTTNDIRFFHTRCLTRKPVADFLKNKSLFNNRQFQQGHSLGFFILLCAAGILQLALGVFNNNSLPRVRLFRMTAKFCFPVADSKFCPRAFARNLENFALERPMPYLSFNVHYIYRKISSFMSGSSIRITLHSFYLFIL